MGGGAAVGAGDAAAGSSPATSAKSSRDALADLEEDADAPRVASPDPPPARVAVPTAERDARPPVLDADASPAGPSSRATPPLGPFGRLTSVARSIPLVGDLFVTSAAFPAEVFDMRLRRAPSRAGASGGGASASASGFRHRARSFGSLLHDATQGKITLQGVSQRVTERLERQLHRFGPAGVELYRFAWQRFNRRVVFHIVFYSLLGSLLAVAWAVAAWNLWCLMGQWVVRRVVWVVGSVLVLAMLPPSFPNAAAHGLSLALVAAELVLFGVNLTLFALVHLAVWLNKYILPHWFHRGRAMAKELASGTVDRDGRAAASMTRERNKLLLALERASGYRDYLAVAAQLDRLPADLGEGGDEWREDDQTTDGYDAALCRIYLTVMRQAREKGDAAALGLALRTVLHRNFGGVDRLFRLRGARAGTKRTAEEFVEELKRSITFLGEAGTPAYDAATSGSGPGRGGVGSAVVGGAAANGPGTRVSADGGRDTPPLAAPTSIAVATPPLAPVAASGRLDSPRGVSLGGGGHARAPDASDARVRETLRLVSEAHRSLGRTALCLSGGGALAMYHFGVIKVLLEEGLLPQVISGTSGGSIVAAFISMFPEEELLRSIRPDLSSRHGVRWFPPVWKMVIHFVQNSVLMSGKEFAETTEAYFGDVTFAEAFAISKRAVSIQISVGWSHGFVLNHFTAPQVVIRTAVNASCALPGLMEPFELLAKDEKTGELIPFHPPGVSSFDGTITADIPSARLTELFNCNNFIVSQVNPHINFVLHLAEEGQGRRLRQARSTDRRAAVTKLLRVANFLLLNIKYGAQKLLEVDLLNLRMVRTLQGILVQDFGGHITVLPELKVRDYWRVLQQPTEDDMARFIRDGERAAWPHVEAIRLTMAAEIALQEAAAALRARQRRAAARRSVGNEWARGGVGRGDGDGGGGGGESVVEGGGAESTHAAHFGAGLSCAVETTTWH